MSVMSCAFVNVRGSVSLTSAICSGRCKQQKQQRAFFTIAHFSQSAGCKHGRCEGHRVERMAGHHVSDRVLLRIYEWMLRGDANMDVVEVTGLNGWHKIAHCSG
jgi:hypothetical protein